jgi:hypothetical protein
MFCSTLESSCIVLGNIMFTCKLFLLVFPHRAAAIITLT